MRVFLGILIGIAIVFNWSTIRNFFDGRENTVAPAQPSAVAPAPASVATSEPHVAAPAPASNAHEDLARSTEQRLKDIAAGK